MDRHNDPYKRSHKTWDSLDPDQMYFRSSYYFFEWNSCQLTFTFTNRTLYIYIYSSTTDRSS